MARKPRQAPRTEYYKQSIENALEEGLISEAQLATIGPTKARYLVAEARREDRPVTDLEIREAKDVSTASVANKAPLVAVTFFLTARQRTQLLNRLKQAGWTPGTSAKHKARALMKAVLSTLSFVLHSGAL